MRTTAVLSSAVLATALLAGCGSSGDSGKSGSESSSSGDYCQQLKAAKKDFSSLNGTTPDFAKFDQAIATFHKLAGDAPSAVAGDWETLDGAFTTLQKDLAAAGLSLKDLGPITKGQMPPGMTQADLAALGPKLQATFAKLDDPRFTTAGKNIEKHAKSVCHVDLTKG